MKCPLACNISVIVCSNCPGCRCLGCSKWDSWNVETIWNNWIRMSYGRDVMQCDRVKTCQYDWRCLCRHVSQRSSSCPNRCNCVAWLWCLHQSTELENFASFSMSNPTICWYKIEYAGFNLLIYIEKVERQKRLYFIPSHIFPTLAETCPNAHLVFWYWSLQNHNQTAASLDAKIC